LSLYRLTPNEEEEPRKKLKSTKVAAPNNIKEILNVRKTYNTYINKLIELLKEENPGIQVPALQILFNFIKRESDIRHTSKETKKTMNVVIFNHLLHNLLDIYNPNVSEDLLDIFTEDYLLKYDDVRYYTVLEFK
jgi:U3 small nucleolar RNA-associated protein 19